MAGHFGLVIGDFVFDAARHRKATGRQIGHGLPVVGSGLTKVIEVGCRPPVSRSRVNKDRNVYIFVASRAQVPVPDNGRGCT